MNANEIWNNMSEDDQLAMAMDVLNSVMKSEKRAARKSRKMQEAAKDFATINTIDKVAYNTIVTYNL